MGIKNVLLFVFVLLTASCVSNSSDSRNKQEDMDTTNVNQCAIDNIMSRVSIRKYTSETVSEKDVETMLKAAMAAPTAGNKQPWKFIVVTDRAKLDSIGESVPYWHMAKSAPLAIIVCGDTENVFPGEGMTYWVQDTSAASENLLLAAHALGLGAVWCGCYPITERVEIIRNLLSIPSTIVPLNVIVIGHPENAEPAKDKYKPENIHYNIW